MMRKKILIFVIMILLICTFTKSTYASNEAEIKLTMDKTTFTIDDQIVVKISLTNNSITEKINGILGCLDYDADIMELKTINMDEIEEEKRAELEELTGGEEIEIISIKEDWLIGIMEDDELEEKILYAVCLNENAGIAQGETKEIGEIKFDIDDAITKATTTINACEVTATAGEEEFEVANASTPDIKIEGEEGASDDGEDEDEPSDNEAEQQNQGTEEKQQIPTKDSTKADKNLAYTGVENIAYYIIGIGLATIITYFRWRKYKQI